MPRRIRPGGPFLRSVLFADTPPVSKLVGGESWTIVAIGEDFLPPVITSEDELPLAARDDNDDWPIQQQAMTASMVSRAAAISLAVALGLPQGPDELTSHALDDGYSISEGSRQPVVVAEVPSAHDDFPQPVALFVDEDYRQEPLTAQDDPVIVNFPTGGSFPSVMAALEEPYALDLKPAQDRIYNGTPLADDALPAAITPSEDYWWRDERTQPTAAQAQTWADENFQVLAVAVDEAYQHQPYSSPDEVVLVSFATGSGYPSVAAALSPDEPYFLDPRAALTPVWNIVLQTHEDLPVGLSGGGFYSPSSPSQQLGIGFVRMGFTEELPFFSIDDADWKAYWIAPALWTEFANTAEAIPPQPEPLNMEDVYDTSVTVPIAPPVAVVFGADEQGGEFIVPPVVETRDLGAKWPVRAREYLTKIKDRFYWFRDESELPKEEVAAKAATVAVAKVEPVVAERVKTEVEVQSAAEVAKRKRIEQMNEAILKLFI